MNKFPSNNNNTQSPNNLFGESYLSTHTRFFKALFQNTQTVSLQAQH